ncbi:MAG: peptidase A2 [Gammaproteobacteria bacterium TMED226]|nr:MAG: peptidase A2 [Gammaproteobacteria bacterium TMED226]
MKFFQTYGINYILVILLTFLGSWYFITNDKNKLVEASEKSIASVVTISSSNNLSFSKKGSGIGSGVIFSNDGYIVTNLHILSGQNINVRLNNGNNYSARIIGIDENTDIAVLKITSSEKLNKINIANSENLKIGDRVLAIGNPYGIGISVSNGIISATGRDYGNPYLQLIQTDAAINPGNSGGALINENGNLVGINSKILSKTGAYQGIGFAIPSNLIVQIASELIQYGKIRTTWIGNFRVARVGLNLEDKLINALKIVEIDNFGPLYDQGVRSNDIIFEIDGNPGTWDNLTKSLRFAGLGEDIKLKLVTPKNEYKSIEITSEQIKKIN